MARVIRLELTEQQAKRLAAYALRHDDWDTLDVIEAVLRAEHVTPEEER